jgi:hypothetical protein
MKFIIIFIILLLLKIKFNYAVHLLINEQNLIENQILGYIY